MSRSEGVREAPMREVESGGREPAGPGWFVVNAADAAWSERPGWGAVARFESGDARFADFGFNLRVLMPGQPATHYHGENAQEAFLVVRGECLAIVEGEERLLRQWDVFHAPAWTFHAFVGAGDGPCALVQVGMRKVPEEVLYPIDPAAQRHGVSAKEETTSPKESYAGRPEARPVPFDPAWLA